VPAPIRGRAGTLQNGPERGYARGVVNRSEGVQLSGEINISGATEVDDGLRDRFLAWQCRLRQIAMRRDGGRPSPGMRPRVLDGDGRPLSGPLTVLLVPRDCEESGHFFRHQVRKTNDPNEIYTKGLGYLQATYFQKPKTFRDEMTALFQVPAPSADTLVAIGRCVLAFDQFNQAYELPCRVRRLDPVDDAFPATLWHNRIFNPQLPDNVTILGFAPDWQQGRAVSPTT